MHTDEVLLLKYMLIKLCEDADEILSNPKEMSSRDLAMAEICAFYEKGSAVESLHPSLQLTKADLISVDC